ncbi:MAG: hypothetical protein AB8F94_11420 [Saprospiraceae bacterium]
MSKKSPEDLDKLFQQEPEQYPYGYNEASWEEMEKLLDKDDRRRFLWWLFFGIGAMILIGSVFFFGKNETEVTDGNLDFDKKEIVQNQNQELNSTSYSDSIFENQKLDVENQNSDLENQNNKSTESSKNIQSNSNVISNKSELNNSESALNENSQQDNYKNKKEDLNLILGDAGLQQNEIRNTIVSDSILVGTNEPNNGFLPKEIELESTKVDSVNVLLNSSVVAPIAFLQIFIPEKESLFDIPSVEKKKEKGLPQLPLKSKNKVLFGVLLGSESTGANFSNLSQLNWKVGTQLEYRFLKRYSASIGANFIRKSYDANGDAYQPDDGGWVYDITPTTVDAVCDILEIPVNISFFQKGNNENGFYSKLGLSSFFMLEEHYWYSYETPIPGQIRYWGGYNENKHWFGIGEIYVGYQRILTPITSLQIEPYFQIPLTGVGNGNVKLWSVGMNLRINFQAN